jgi:hypothetical protein
LPRGTAGNANLTYAELDERANQLAHRLRELHVRPEMSHLISPATAAMNITHRKAEGRGATSSKEQARTRRVLVVTAHE